MAVTGASHSWLMWALLSATFAALTAIFAKIGVDGVDSDLATFIRTLVIVAILLGMVAVGGKFAGIAAISSRTWLFLGLSGLATGASWLCYFRALKLGDASRVAADRQAERGAGRGDCRGRAGRAAVAHRVARHCADRRRRGACGDRLTLRQPQG